MREAVRDPLPFARDARFVRMTQCCALLAPTELRNARLPGIVARLRFSNDSDARESQTIVRADGSHVAACPQCKRAVKVRKRLLLVLPNGDKYLYVCPDCGSTCGETIEIAASASARQVLTEISLRAAGLYEPRSGFHRKLGSALNGSRVETKPLAGRRTKSRAGSSGKCPTLSQTTIAPLRSWGAINSMMGNSGEPGETVHQQKIVRPGRRSL